ncbi:hypothetical protein ABZY44_32200 [Streptomyces sp. NPDC006544]|uniref:hypothetical protein n=1 Tax=Streptomyces sp. NPDC006544 TaxID=3154583 RepID=UPI00339E47ED
MMTTAADGFPSQLRLGDDISSVRLTAPETADGFWRLTADWDGCFSADFEAAGVSTGDVAAFADRLLEGFAPDEPFAPREHFSVVVSEGRDNPLSVHVRRLDDSVVFLARVTPCGHDETSHLDLEIGAVPLGDQLAHLEAFRRELA